jgi:hypothetical protein
MIKSTEEIIYAMLTESTGTNFLDSGGDNGRFWQRNQTKTLEDFKAQELLEIDHKYNEITLNIFPFLNEHLEYNYEETNNLYKYLLKYNYDFNNSNNIIDFFNAELFPEEDAKQLNSYNEDCILSQTIQLVWSGDLHDHDLIALSIHNGADVRGGYTDFKLFNADIDGLLNYHPESWSHVLEEESV